MKKILLFFTLFTLAALTQTVNAHAKLGDLGFFGGISEGRRLPRTTETLFAQTGGRAADTQATMAYKEQIFLHMGEPVTFEGLIDVTETGAITGERGNFAISQTIYPSEDAPAGAPSITRVADFAGTYYRYTEDLDSNQYVFNLDIDKNSWAEEIIVDGITYTLDTERSDYQLSFLEDRTPGVNYRKGNVSGRLIYTTDEEAPRLITLEITGTFSGYDSVWSSSETQRYNVSLTSDGVGMQYEVRPSVSVNKTLQYSANEPSIISFEGNYMEVLQNFSGLRYDIFLKPPNLWYIPEAGTVNISIPNTFEQLPEPELSFLRGNAFEDDIRRLYSMQILSGDPRYFNPSQAISRGQFMTALAKAIKLPIQDLSAAPQGTRRIRNNTNPSVVNLWSDVDSTMPEYPYMLALRDAGIAFGHEDGAFYFNYAISRQEVFTVLVRALGLTNIGLNPTAVTPFTDSADIGEWYIREVSVAQSLGLIAPDENGMIYPDRAITKGEAASLLNVFIEFMRNGFMSEYVDQIVNIAS
jgi:hypothetical protein